MKSKEKVSNTNMGTNNLMFSSPIVLKHDFSTYLEKRDNSISSAENGEKEDTIPFNGIKSLTQVYTVDPKLKSCDVKVSERIRFNLPNISINLNYIIISKKFPLYGFNAKLLKVYDKNLEKIANQIKEVRLFKDSSSNSRTFADLQSHKLQFRDAWLVNIELKYPVKDIEIEIEYKMQRAIQIDNLDELNYLKLELVNPNSSNIDDYKLIIELKNYKGLNAQNLKMPKGTYAQQNGDDVVLSTHQPLDKYSGFEMDFSLPYEIFECEGEIVNIVYYGLIGMSILFLLMSVFTIAYLYKE
jgi:hypothetical protein